MNIGAKRDRWVESHMPLIDKIVARERRRLSANASLAEEIRSFALEGFVKAMNKYDPDKGVAFRHYAEQCIRFAIYDGLGTLSWLPKNLRRKIRSYNQAQEVLAQSAESPPPKDKVDAVHRLAGSLKELACVYFVSYEASLSNEPAQVAPDAESAVLSKESSSRLASLVDELPEKEKKIIHGYFFEDKKLYEIAEDLGISISWVSKLLRSALFKLRTAFEKRPEFLTYFEVQDTS